MGDSPSHDDDSNMSAPSVLGSPYTSNYQKGVIEWYDSPGLNAPQRQQSRIMKLVARARSAETLSPTTSQWTADCDATLVSSQKEISYDIGSQSTGMSQRFAARFGVSDKDDRSVALANLTSTPRHNNTSANGSRVFCGWRRRSLASRPDVTESPETKKARENKEQVAKSCQLGKEVLKMLEKQQRQVSQACGKAIEGEDEGNVRNEDYERNRLERAMGSRPRPVTSDADGDTSSSNIVNSRKRHMSELSITYAPPTAAELDAEFEDNVVAVTSTPTAAPKRKRFCSEDSAAALSPIPLVEKGCETPRGIRRHRTSWDLRSHQQNRIFSSNEQQHSKDMRLAVSSILPRSQSLLDPIKDDEDSFWDDDVISGPLEGQTQNNQ